MKKVVGAILILLALFAGYQSFNILSNSKAGIKIGELEISAEDSGKKNTGYLYLGGAIVCMIAGVYLIGKKK